MNRHKVAVVGPANADLVLDIDHRPAPGETILGSDVVVTPGGKGANQAVAAGRLGGDVTFVGCLGEDGNGRLLRASLADAGVDLSGLRLVDAPTGIAIIMVTPDGENSIIVAPGANRHVTPGMLDEVDQWRAAAVVVLQLEIPLESVTKVATEARGRVVLNTAPAAELPAEVIALADPLVANESRSDGENSIIVAPGANRHVTPGMLDEVDQWRAAAVVVLQLEIPLESVTKVATEARGRVVLNTAPAAELPAEVIALADPLVANES